MTGSLRWAAAFLILLLVTAVLFWAGGKGQIRVALGETREMRVLKISFGTNHVLSAEPRWKQFLRAALPIAWQKPLGTFQGQRFSTAHDTLVLWVGDFSTQTGNLRTGYSGGALQRPEVVFTNGYVAQGRRRTTANGNIALEFPCYPRDASQVPLRIHDGTNSFSFTLDNPHRVRPANWTGHPLPQTNYSLQTVIVLKSGGFDERSGYVLVRAHPAGESVLGWMAWRVTALDVWGNWAGDSWSFGAVTPRIPALPPDKSPYKVIVEGQEYISAGRVPTPTNGTSLVLAPTSRMRDFGIETLLLLGGGSYQIQVQASGIDVLPVVDPALSPSNNLALAFSAASSSTKWVMSLATPLPGIFCLSEIAEGTPVFSARLRERDETGGGRVLGQAKGIKATHLASKKNAQFFPVRQPFPVTNLEVEVIVNLPATEFYVNRTAR